MSMDTCNLVKCDYCDKTFRNRKCMTNHRRWHDLDKYKEFQENSRENGRRMGKFVRSKETLEKMRMASLGRKMPKESILKLKKSLKGVNKGKKNGMWTDKPQMSPLHQWVKRNIKTKKICVDCGKTGKLDLANISQEYKRDLSDWEWLCRRCHMKKDGRLEKWLEQNHGRKKQCVL